MKIFGQDYFEVCIADLVRRGAFLLLFLLPASTATSQDSDLPQAHQPTSEEIGGFVTQLGSEDFEVREMAESKLLKSGQIAIAHVEQARRSKNSEIRFRARRLYSLLKRSAFDSSLENFVNEPSDSANQLAGWKEFSAIVGTDENARKLFAVNYKASPELFNALGSNSDETRIRYRTLYNKMTRARFRSLSAATILFLDSMDSASSAEQERNEQNYRGTPRELTRTATYMSSNNMVTFVAVSGYEDLFKKLLTHWIDNLPEDGITKASRMKIAEAHRLTAKLSFILEVAFDENESSQTRARAIQIASRLGTREDVEKLQTLLQNTEAVGHFSVPTDSKKRIVELRDVALATCLKLCGENSGDYGFETTNEGFISISESGFYTTKEREQAYEKWNHFYQENIRSD